MKDLNIRVALKDEKIWPNARGHDLFLVSIPDPAKKLAVIRYTDASGTTHQQLVTKASLIILRDQPQEPSSLDDPPLRWGAIVTIRNNRKVFCTHPELEPNGNWRGIPLGYRSFGEFHYSEIVHIEPHNDISSQVA
ncbi:hypothetical protein [Halomonas sp. 707B3]|uniref:hypothetical protein n=1 Tax=Halomonas sp. 707B3 TaxID=1681043 RepID=UPI00209DF362|nr:hypothetical protein [Halomonas sp. 707B3]MCP1316867.1 hypothetical protein [Halomonas sp. 707B3]